MYKKYMLAVATLVAACTGAAYGAQDTVFEFWNKMKKQPVRIYVWQPGEVPYHQNSTIVAPRGRVTKTRAQLDPNRDTFMLLQRNAGPLTPTSGYEVFKFPRNKDLFVRITEDGKRFGRQTGPLKGLKKRTESGLPLKNIVQDKDIVRVGFDFSIFTGGKAPAAEKAKVPKTPHEALGIKADADDYEILKLETKETTPLKDIRAAWKKLVMKWHPDKATREMRELHTEVTKLIHDAYKRLEAKFQR